MQHAPRTISHSHKNLYSQDILSLSNNIIHTVILKERTPIHPSLYRLNKGTNNWVLSNLVDSLAHALCSILDSTLHPTARLIRHINTLYIPWWLSSSTYSSLIKEIIVKIYIKTFKAFKLQSKKNQILHDTSFKHLHKKLSDEIPYNVQLP